MKRTAVLHPSVVGTSPQGGEAFPRAVTNTLRYAPEGPLAESRQIICEQDVHIVLNEKPLVTLLCSSTSLCELAVGFLYSEQVVDSLRQIASLDVDQQTRTVRVTLNKGYTAPDCPVVTTGFGGRALVSEASLPATRRAGAGEDVQTAAPRAIACVRAMCDSAREYQATRGIHCSALFDGPDLVALFEDVGRHNTFDKLAGHCLLHRIDPVGLLLTTTGRVSGDMMRKALRLGVCGVASCSGPTDVSVRLAREGGALLVGYSCGTSPVVYAGPGFSKASEDAARATASPAGKKAV